jgi:regulator-associated protein of mTOR
MYYTDKRHETGGKPKDEDHSHPPQEWRMRDRLKTVSAALAICLNIGVDPPDVVKTNPTAKLECWIDPTSTTHANSKTMEAIGKKLQEQYETLSIRVRYKQYLDPSVDETRKFCTSLRRNAKDERILFHYNGHGVPLPTQSGEIWVFNRNYTQYIPVSLYDLQAWLGAPSLYVFDCSHAGNIIQSFDRFVEKHEAENIELRQQDPTAQLQSYSDNILLAACRKTESLPTNPDLPADLFTSCLTSPIEMSLTFFILENPLPSNLTKEDALRVPGRLQERRSPIGELNWIFTAITDTIAWNLLPRPIFKKLFRQDLMVAALFRNFLLSERIMRAHGCHPMSMPALPDTHDHPLWQSWDLACEMVLAQLPAMLANEAAGVPYEYQHSNFFTEQLTAFEVYLSHGAPSQAAPSQLPIVLQVLLSQVHRLRALILLSRFLDLGPWAVNLALTIGIFPYVLKLLQSAAFELKPVMIFIWARILAVDGGCQQDLIKDNGYQYFLTMLNPQAALPVQNASEHRAMSAFIVAMFCRNFPQGQVVCLSPELIEVCIVHLRDTDNPLLRQWSCLCISMLWADFPEAKWVGIRCMAHQRLCEMALDPVPEVRAAALHALTNFLGIPDLTEQVRQSEESIASAILIMTADGNNMVRKELLVFFSTFVQRYKSKFLVAAYEQLVEERDSLLHPGAEPCLGKPQPNGQHHRNLSDSATVPKISANSVQGSIWMHLLVMTVDPHAEVAQNAGIIVDYVHESLLTSVLGPRAQVLIDDIVRLSRRPVTMSRQPSVAPTSRPAQTPVSPTLQASQKAEGYLSIGMRRTASVAAALKHLALGTSASSDNLPTSLQTASGSSSSQPHGAAPPPPRTRVPAEWSRPPNENDHAPTSAGYQQSKTPAPRGFKPRDVSQSPSIPLVSEFFDWSIEVIRNRAFDSMDLGLPSIQYFREPQMKPNEPDEPGSDDYNGRLWRRVRNEKTLANTQPLKSLAGASHWDIPKGFFNNGSQPMKLCFHQFEDHLAVSDDRDSIW